MISKQKHVVFKKLEPARPKGKHCRMLQTRLLGEREVSADKGMRCQSRGQDLAGMSKVIVERQKTKKEDSTVRVPSGTLVNAFKSPHGC